MTNYQNIKIKYMKILGLITARAGSKRIPGKNMKRLGGDHLIEYTYKAARDSELRTLAISTDDQSVLSWFSKTAIARIERPDWLCTDRTPHLPVVIHALEFMADQGYHPDAVMILQPTSPFRTAKHINEAIEIFKTGKYDSIVSVDRNNKRNGAIYLFRTEQVFSKEPTFFSKDNGTVYVMDDRSSINIDTPDDFALAEKML
jgi:CMP-N-acetylneuraminic acid synthetase